MPTLAFTLIQTNIFEKDKIANLKMLEEKILSVKQKTQVVILPEMFSTGYCLMPKTLSETMNGETIAWMKKIAAQKKIILTGSMIAEENGKYFNRLIWMQPNGQFGFYDKRHRFRFGGENIKYAAGTKRFIASVNGWKINLQICYDLRFPVWSRQQFNNGYEYDVLIYIANWAKDRIYQWKSLLAARAIENQCYVIGVNRIGKDNVIYGGNSMVINSKGETLYCKEDDEDVYTIALDKEALVTARNDFPLWKDADAFKIINKE